MRSTMQDAAVGKIKTLSSTHWQSLSLAASLLVIVLGANEARAVELANIDAAGPGTASAPTLSIPSGQSTANFFVETATGAGVYPVRIGASRTDDYAGGVLLGSARENGGRVDGLETPFWPVISAGANSQSSTAPDGTLNLFVRQRVGATTNVPSNSNVAGAYFPFSEGWVGATTRNSANGGAPNSTSAVNGVTVNDLILGFGQIEGGVSRVVIPGVTDTRQQGLLFANHSKNEDNQASVAPSASGDAFIVGTQNAGNAMANEADPYAFVYIPFGTSNITMASVHGASGPDQHATVMKSSGSPFSVTREGVGTYRLSIPGQNPTTGVLLTNTGGQNSAGATSTSNHVVTYQADGNDWIIQTRDWGSGTPTLVAPFLETPNADRSQAFQFAFMPFATPPTAPGPTIAPLNLKDKVLGFNVQVTEANGASNENPGMYGVVTGGTSGYNIQHLRQNRGDNSIAINGVFPSQGDGVMFASVNQGFRDNSTTSGEAAYGMIAAGDGGGGWEFATHVADPGLGDTSAVEMNVNFSAVMFGNTTPFQKATNASQTGGALTVTLSGVNTLNSGVLVAQVWGNNDDFAVATPAADGSNWTVHTYDNNTSQSTTQTLNWIYLPYSATNLVAGRVSAEGTLQASTNPADFTLTKQGYGQYLLTIPGKTPADGTLLLTPEQTGGAEDNLLVYEAQGNSFLITGVDQVSFAEKSSAIFPAPEDTSFTFAFIDHDAPPSLTTPLQPGDFDGNGLVNANDLDVWRQHMGTGTTRADGDADGDHDVDGVDFLVWQQQLQNPGASPSSGAAPEPASIGLAGLALAAGAAARRRRVWN